VPMRERHRSRSARWLLAATFVACLLGACSGKGKGVRSTRGTLVGVDRSIEFEFAVYLLPTSKGDPEKVFRDTVAAEYPQLKIVDKIKQPTSDSERTVSELLEKDVQKSYAPPDLEMLRHAGAGLTPEQERALQGSDRALIVRFGHSSGQHWVGLRTANELIEKIARKTSGLVWDEQTREVFTPDAWHERRMSSWDGEIPNVASQTTIHVYQSGAFVRAITLGMAKMGLPDVVVNDFTWSSENQIGNLINAFSQILAEGMSVPVPGNYELNLETIKNARAREHQTNDLIANATGAAYLWLDKGKWEDGDPKNRLIELSAERYRGPDIHARQEKMLGCMFGSEDKVTYIEHTDELLQVSRAARTKLPELRAAFKKGLTPGEYIEVKAPFTTRSGGNEWMWVEVTKWEGDKIEGSLNNDPEEVEGLRSGQIVKVSENDVFDYMRFYPDRRKEGNTTGDVIKKMGKEHDEEIHPFRKGATSFVARHGVPGCEPD